MPNLWQQFKSRALGFVLGMVASLFGVAICIFLLIVFTPQLTREPVSVGVVDSGMRGPVCPGEEITSTVAVTIEGSMIVDVFAGAMGYEDAYATSGGPEGNIIKPGEEVAVSTMPVVWEVPAEDAGEYNYVYGYDARGGNAKTVYLLVPFTINENCE